MIDTQDERLGIADYERLEQSETDCSIYGDIALVASLSKLYRYFYPWAVAKIDGSRERIEKIIFRETP